MRSLFLFILDSRVGLSGWYRQFVGNNITLIFSLNHLRKTKKLLSWNEEAEDSLAS